MQCRLRKTGLRAKPGGRVREVRVEEDREAHVAFRHGQVLGRIVLFGFFKRLKLRRLLVLVLRGMSLAAGVASEGAR